MDVNSLFSHGGLLVKNPNYSPNNGQPEYIRNTDISKTTSGLASTVSYAAGKGLQRNIGDEYTNEKLRKYGITPTTYNTDPARIDKTLYDAQSGLSMFLNAVEQTVVSEIGLGTLKGFSEIGDMIGNAISQDKDFFHQGALTKWLSNLQEKND